MPIASTSWPAATPWWGTSGTSTARTACGGGGGDALAGFGVAVAAAVDQSHQRLAVDAAEFGDALEPEAAPAQGLHVLAYRRSVDVAALVAVAGAALGVAAVAVAAPQRVVVAAALLAGLEEPSPAALMPAGRGQACVDEVQADVALVLRAGDPGPALPAFDDLSTVWKSTSGLLMA